MQYSKNELVVALAKVYGLKELRVVSDADVETLAKTLLTAFELESKFGGVKVKSRDCRLFGDMMFFSYDCVFFTKVKKFIGNFLEGPLLAIFAETMEINERIKKKIDDLLARAATMEPKREAQSDGRKQCVACGIAYPNFAKFCRTCGTELTVA